MLDFPLKTGFYPVYLFLKRSGPHPYLRVLALEPLAALVALLPAARRVGYAAAASTAAAAPAGPVEVLHVGGEGGRDGDAPENAHHRGEHQHQSHHHALKEKG